MVKNPPANARDIRDAGTISGWGRYPGEGRGNPRQYSCLENPMKRGAWWDTVHGMAKSRAWLKWLSSMHDLDSSSYRVLLICWPLALQGPCLSPSHKSWHLTVTTIAIAHLAVAARGTAKTKIATTFYPPFNPVQMRRWVWSWVTASGTRYAVLLTGPAA